MPVRVVTPTTLAAVSSGRREGHLQRSRIVNVGFVAGRHSAIISADEHGLAFFHSLGKVLFVEASDILRILGKYPTEDISGPYSSSPAAQSLKNVLSPGFTPLRRKSRYTILAMMPLPLGTSPHPTDSYNIIALLTPTKLVVVGLKPLPKTWFKCPREGAEVAGSSSRSKWKGTLVWYPSVAASSADITTSKSGASGVSEDNASTPVLAYSWGNTLHLICVSEKRIRQSTRHPRSGKVTEVEVGSIIYEQTGKWVTDDDILATQWLNAKVSSLFTRGVDQD